MSSGHGRDIGPGFRAGHYVLADSIGAGGMGRVYRAHDERLQRDVALKFLHDDVEEADALPKLLGEARAAATLNHPNICTVYEVGEAAGLPFIAMELIDGTTLGEQIGTIGLPPDRVIRLGAQIADALAHAHERGVVHRDLKSANVIVTSDGRAKVLDFGIARARGLASHTAETRSGRMIAGTPHYLPPEVLEGHSADARSDLWALGVLLYEMASGVMPFRGNSLTSLTRAILHESPAPLPARVPAGLRAVIERCLSKPPGERYRSAGEARAALEALQSHSGELELVRRRTRRIAWSAGVVAALVVAIFASLRVAGVSLPAFGAGSASLRSIAVLPLANLTGDPAQEYFSDGMTEELIAALAPIESLTVISRTSVMRYKRTTKPLAEIARELNVDGIVEGSVAREGESVRIRVQLFDPRTEKRLWGADYQRELSDVLELQKHVARDIARRIRVELSPDQRERLGSTQAVNPQTYELYLKGRASWALLTEAGLVRAIEYFNRVLEIDSTDARAWAGLADAWMVRTQVVGSVSFFDGLPRADSCSRRALQLDPDLAEARASFATARWLGARDWNGAREDYERALELNSGYATAQIGYALLLGSEGRHEQAIAHMDRALELDPLSTIVRYTRIWEFVLARRFAQAEAAAEQLFAEDSSFVPALTALVHIAERRGDYPRAIRLQTGLERAQWGGSEFARRLRRGYEAGGAGGYWQVQLETSLARARTMRVTATWLAGVYANLGRKEEALQWLERAVVMREGDVMYLNEDSFFDPLRDAPRFQNVIRSVGLTPKPAPVAGVNE